MKYSALTVQVKDNTHPITSLHLYDKEDNYITALTEDNMKLFIMQVEKEVNAMVFIDDNKDSQHKGRVFFTDANADLNQMYDLGNRIVSEILEEGKTIWSYQPTKSIK